MAGLLTLSASLLLILLSATTTALSFPPWGLRGLAFVSLVPLFHALRRGGLLRGMLLATLWCVIYAGLIASVFPTSVSIYFDRPLWFGIATTLLVFTSMAGLYYALFAAVYRALLLRPSAFTPLLVAAAWVGAELARGRLFTGTPFFIGNPWGLLGYSHASGPLAQIASLAGVYGISFTLVAVNAGLAGLIDGWRLPHTRMTAFRGLGLSLLLAAAAALYGSAVLDAAPEPDDQVGLQPVALVQGNVSIDRRWRSDFHAKNLDVYLQLTAKVLQDGSPRLIVWPETSMNFFVEDERRYRSAIQRTLALGDAPLLAGGPRASPGKQPPYFNSAFLIDATNGVSQHYDKMLLVPFAESMPRVFGRDLIRRQIEGVRVFEPGPSDQAPLETPIGRAGVLICNEAMLPEVVADRVRAGAQVLINPSNDSWITGRAFQEHMLAVVALRAIEQRRYLVRASTAGPSAIIDPYGRVMARSDPFVATTFTGRVRAEDKRTLYARLGDTFATGCLIWALTIAGRNLRSTRRSNACIPGPEAPNSV
jgi:apolipoprotein N-acyltransferase